MNPRTPFTRPNRLHARIAWLWGLLLPMPFDCAFSEIARAGDVPFASQSVITTGAGTPQAVFTADVDGDGDLDALTASELDNKIAWYENDGASPPGWTARTISTAALTASSVHAADVDGDGDVDALSASQVVPRLESLSSEELEAVREYESGTRGRKTILTKIAQLQAS